ncbi:hypothetical protein ACJX0J_005317 [Zea mays]
MNIKLLSSRMLGDLRDDPIRDPVIDTIYEGADYPHNEFLSRKLNAITQFVWGMFNILFGTGMFNNPEAVINGYKRPRTWIIIKNLEEDLQAYSNKLSTHFSRLLPFWSKRMALPEEIVFVKISLPQFLFDDFIVLLSTITNHHFLINNLPT